MGTDGASPLGAVSSRQPRTAKALAAAAPAASSSAGATPIRAPAQPQSTAPAVIAPKKQSW